MSTTEIFLNSDVKKAIKHVFETYRQLDNCETTFFRSEKHPIVFTHFQTIFSLKFENKLHRTIHEYVLEHLLKSERVSPGSFDVALRKLLELSNNEFSEKQNSNFPEPSCHIISKNKCVNLDDIKKIVDSFTKISSNHELISSMLFSAIELAGYKGKICVEKNSGIANVELISGNVFSLQPAVSNSYASYYKPIVIIIDGFIESIGEIHSLFEQIIESEQVCFLFVRGMHDDVKNTINVNFLRGKLKVIPIIVPYDFSGVNTLVDLAVVCDSEVVSTHKGELISSIKLNDHKQIDRIDVTKNGITIFNKNSTVNVQKHLSNLLQKRSEQESDFGFFDNRIKSLSSNTVFVRLNDDINYSINSQIIDFTLRTIKVSIDRGIQKINNRLYPGGTVEISEFFAKKCLNALSKLGAILSIT